MTAPALTQYAQGRNQVSADQLNTFEQTCNTYADLRTFVGAIGQQVFVRGGLTINDGLAGPFYWAATATAADDGGFIIAPTGAAIGRWLRVDHSQVTAGVIYLPLYGAKFDGVTDDTAAWQRAIVAANALTYATIVMPQGRSVVSGVLTPPTVPCTIKGQGMESSIIDWANTANLFFRDTSLSTLPALGFQDFQVKGKWATLQSDIPFVIPILIRSTDDVRIERVKIYNVTGFGITTRVCNRVFISGCQILECARDGINAAVCNFVQIVDNRIDHCDDDAIAVSTQIDGPDFINLGVVIANNRITDSQGIKCLGSRRLAITGNQIDRVRGQGITVGGSDLGDAVTTPFSITVTGNVITDVINRFTIDGLNNGNPYIVVACVDQTGPGAALPGHFVSGTGVLVPLYSNLPNDAAADPLAPSHFVNVSNNVCTRTLEENVLYSTYGYGEMFTRYGYLDPLMTPATLSTTAIGITIGTGARYVHVVNNIINGMVGGILLTATASTDFQQLRITGNTVADFSVYGLAAASGVTGGVSIAIEGNTFDGDPYHLNANRGANGTWLASGSPLALLLQASTGHTIRGNIIKRVCRVMDLATSTNQALFLHNFIEAQVAATGFSTSNVGVGNCPLSGPGFIYRIVDNNNASATYQNTLNNCFVENSAMPSTGTYVRGHFVANNTPTIAAKIIGWLRITTGASHVLGTDWLAVTSV